MASSAGEASANRLARGRIPRRIKPWDGSGAIVGYDTDAPGASYRAFQT